MESVSPESSCQVPSVTSVTAWATSPESAPWEAVQASEAVGVQGKNATSATVQVTLLVTARRRRITATAVMVWATLPRTVNILQMNPHATTAPRWATSPGIVQSRSAPVTCATRAGTSPDSALKIRARTAMQSAMSVAKLVTSPGSAPLEESKRMRSDVMCAALLGISLGSALRVNLILHATGAT